MGGSSAEREVSIASGQGVMRALQSLGYDAQSLDYDRRFFDAIRDIMPDVVFIALHGPGGEDGHVQALLDYLAIPYQGSGVEASALAMDKHLTKKLLAAEGLPTAAWDLFDLAGGTLPLLAGFARSSARDQAAVRRLRRRRDYREDARTVDECDAQCREDLSRRSWPKSTSKAASLRFAILGEEALPVIEIVPTTDDFYTYEAKYGPAEAAHRAGEDRRRSGRAPADARALDAPSSRIARLLAHRLSSSPRKAARKFSRSTRCPASRRRVCCPKRARRSAFRTKR